LIRLVLCTQIGIFVGAIVARQESSNLKELKKNRMSSMPKVTIREELAQATQQLPLPVARLMKDMNVTLKEMRVKDMGKK
jgi:hypothetical protein